MTVKELYDYITSHLTPEEALMRSLEASLIKYETLKFNEGEEIHPLILISMAAMDMGWCIAIIKDGEDVGGVSVGTKEYLDKLLKIKSQKGNNYESTLS